jgi:hypothetical protein
MIPRVTIDDIRRGLSPEQQGEIRRAGCVVVKGAVPKEVKKNHLILRRQWYLFSA